MKLRDNQCVTDAFGNIPLVCTLVEHSFRGSTPSQAPTLIHVAMHATFTFSPASGFRSKMASDVRPQLTLNYQLPNTYSHSFHSFGSRHDVGGGSQHCMLQCTECSHFHPLADLDPK